MNKSRLDVSKTARSGRFAVETRQYPILQTLRRFHLGRALTLRRLAVMCGLVFLGMLPHFWGTQMLPYRLRQVLRHPIHARVDFSWQNPNVAAEEERLTRARFWNYYKPDVLWVDHVFDPVYNLLYESYNLATDRKLALPAAVEKLKQYAKRIQFTLDADDARILVEELRKRQGRFFFEEDLIKPGRYKILQSSKFSAGVLSAQDFRRESQRPINITANIWDEVSQPVGGPDGPISIQQAPRLLTEYADVELTRFGRPFRRVYARLLAKQMRPSLSYDRKRTEGELAEEIRVRLEEVQNIAKGAIIMDAGRPIERLDLERLQAESAAYEATTGSMRYLMRLVGMAALLMISALGFLFYLEQFERSVFLRGGDLAGILLLAAIVLVVLQLGAPAVGWRLTLVPLGIVAGVAAITFGPRVGVGTASVLAFSGFITTEVDVAEVLALLGSSWIFCCLAPSVRHRSGLLRSGLMAGAVSFLTISFWRMADNIPFTQFSEGSRLWNFFAWSGAWDMLFWIVGAMVLTVALPVLERLFGAATNVTLLELSDQEHPCLRRLVLDAPGTYHHSVIVGNLAEKACEAVDGNPLLARVASYYHDIGKIIKPEYFTENDAGRSRHDRLAPSISTLIITAHVKDGVEMARRYRLPQAIIDIIEQHHGDGRVGFFYTKAQEQAENPELVQEASYRYPGPLPRSIEAAIVMLADSVEAASRSLQEPTPSHIEKLVHRIVNGKLMARQLDASPLTFRDISMIEQSFVRTLNAMHHSRVRYPDFKRGRLS